MKWIKKLFKCMLIFIAGIIGIAVVLVGITIVNTNWHTKKFRFENFKTAEELTRYIETNFPNGSDGHLLIDMLEKAGAKRELVPQKYYSQEDIEMGTDYLYRFYYNAGWLYYPQSMGYIVILSLNNNHKLLNSRAVVGYVGL